ncbi:MAG: methyltransferase domain-containing protein [Bacillota bacterium]|nr:methyltransferase domain-containing protein [Bacillota bacterium]
MDSIKRSIETTKKSFELSFGEEQFYNKQTQDEKHLKLILDSLKLTNGMKILDLGTGNGYMAFPIAVSNPGVEVIGLDIVEQTLSKNRSKAEMMGIGNLKFCAYDGVTFPFKDNEFDYIISRYALHHFPKLNVTFSEMNRVLKANGKLVISDPTPNSNDSSKFVDEFMQMKEDGHIQFYSLQEYVLLAKEANFKFISNTCSEITFPRKNAKSYEYLLNKHSKEITDGYHINVINDEIYITEQVLNMIFEKDLA